jgi:uncharacterized protein (TIGR02246 family)
LGNPRRDLPVKVLKADKQTELEIIKIFNKYAELCKKKDVQGCLDLFATDPDTLGLGSEEGEEAIGREDLRLFFERAFSRPLEYTFEWQWFQVSQSGSVAWAIAEGVIHADGRNQGRRSTPYRMTAVFERMDSTWLWSQLHGSVGVEPYAGKKFKAP